MRVTNSMINRNNIYNINNNKTAVDRMNTQMSTQKKISRPSEDPVIAIRSLRLRTTLSEINQFYEKNIPDAESWLDVTEGALYNIVTLLGDVNKQCNYGANGSLTQDNRNDILKNLKGIKSQIYAEMNTDEAGRSVFGGYKTNKTVTLIKDEPDMEYSITEKFTFEDINEKKYYGNKIEVPTGDIANSTPPTADANTPDMPFETTNYRVRLAYDQTEKGQNTLTGFKYTGLITDGNGKKPGEAGYTETQGTYTYPSNHQGTPAPVNWHVGTISYAEWQKNGFDLKDDAGVESDILYIPDTGEIIFSDSMKSALESGKSSFEVTYDKKGFSKEDVRPEMYFDCTDKKENITYTKERQEIEYTIAFNQNLTINTQPEDVITADVGRDIEELEEAVQAAINAHDKVDAIKQKMSEERYSDSASQEKLTQWLEAAQKECDYADDNMKNLFSKNIGNFERHQQKAILARTDVGSKGDRLSLTKNRMLSQQETFEELKSKNEDREISDIVLDYTSAYYAYQASLQAAGKANSTSLLDYI
ncbi:MAG: flagellar hook-associated protein 3 [Lachnospiraceae bacterium]